MKRFSTTNDFINNHVRSGGFPAGEVVEMLGYNSAGDQGAALWKSTGLTIAASQTVIDTNDIKISDASGNEFELVHIGIIDLNALGGTGGAYVTIATNAGLTWSQSFSSIPSSATINYDTVSDMINASGLSVGDKIQTAEFSTGNGGGGVYDVVLTSGVMPNGYNIIQGVADTSISFVLRQNGNIVDVAAYGWSSVSDSYAAIQQAASDLSDGGTLFFNPIMRALITGSQVVNITADDVTVIGWGAELWSENSDDPESTVQNAVYPQLSFEGERCKLYGLSWRGGLFGVTASVFHAYGQGARCYNLHNVGFGLASTASYEYIYIDGYTFDTSRDSSAGNFTSIQRGGTASDPRGGTIIINNCKWKGTAGGVNIHNFENVYILNADMSGVNINNFKIDEGTQNLVVTGVFDGAAINGASANRHLNSGSDYCGFIAGVAAPNDIKSIDLDIELKNFTGTRGVDFIDSSSMYKTTAKIKATDCTVPVFDRCPGFLDLDLDIENCGADSVKIAATSGVAAISQKIKGTMKDSQLTIGNSASNTRESLIISECDVDYNATDAIKAVDTSPSSGFEVDDARIRECNVKVTTGTGINGSAGSFNLTIEPSVVIEGATTPFTGKYSQDYETTGTGNFPVIKRGILRYRATSAPITRTIIDANAKVGDIIDVINDSGGTLSLSFTSGSCDGFGTTQLTTDGAFRCVKTATSNVWQSVSSRGTINQF